MGRHLSRPVRRIAVLNPLNDYGVSGYTHEFAQGLAANGYAVSVFSDTSAPLQELPDQRHYDLYPVLNKALLKQAALPRLISPIQKIQSTSMFYCFGAENYKLSLTPAFHGREPVVHSALPIGASSRGVASNGIFRAVRRGTNLIDPARIIKDRIRRWARVRYLSSELACYLRMKNYDLIWTQWYEPGVFDSAYWQACRKLGLRVIHTAHNILPHEPAPGDWETYDELYANSTVLVVHSHHSQDELRNEFPVHAPKSVVMPHGTYSSLYKRNPQARDQVRQALGIKPESPVLLFCGAIRPYKNIDAVIEALTHPAFSDCTLIIAGKESKYTDSNPTDPLKRTKMLLNKWRVSCHVRLIPRMLDTTEMSELFEASDGLLLPYLKGYGSGLLLLGITYGKHIVATATGGSQEYLQDYGNHTLLAGPSSRDLALGLKDALARIRRSPVPAEPPISLSWSYITARAMDIIERRIAASN